VEYVDEPRKDAVPKYKLVAEDNVARKIVDDVEVANICFLARVSALSSENVKPGCVVEIAVVVKFLRAHPVTCVELQHGVENHAIGMNEGAIDEFHPPRVPSTAANAKLVTARKLSRDKHEIRPSI